MRGNLIEAHREGKGKSKTGLAEKLFICSFWKKRRPRRLGRDCDPGEKKERNSHLLFFEGGRD